MTDKFFGEEYNCFGRKKIVVKPLGPLIEIDMGEMEARTLAHMADADRMENDDTFKRKDDIRDVDVRKLGNALSRPNSGNIPVEGVVKDVDIHKIQAAELFEVPEAEVSKEMRSFAKCFTFRKLYGGECAEVEALVRAAVAAARTRLSK